jgi:hypothetical protein
MLDHQGRHGDRTTGVLIPPTHTSDYPLASGDAADPVLFVQSDREELCDADMGLRRRDDERKEIEREEE